MTCVIGRGRQHRAGDSGTTLSEIVTDALRAFPSSAREPEARYRVVTFGAPGGRFPAQAEIDETLESEDAEALRLRPKGR